jgi:hypothetical protein
MGHQTPLWVTRFWSQLGLPEIIYIIKFDLVQLHTTVNFPYICATSHNWGLPETIYIIQFNLVHANVNFHYISMQLLHDPIQDNAITMCWILIEKLVGFHRVTYNFKF